MVKIETWVWNPSFQKQPQLLIVKILFLQTWNFKRKESWEEGKNLSQTRLIHHLLSYLRRKGIEVLFLRILISLMRWSIWESSLSFINSLGRFILIETILHGKLLRERICLLMTFYLNKALSIFQVNQTKKIKNTNKSCLNSNQTLILKTTTHSCY